MIKLEWTDGKLGTTVERGWITAWIELLDGEGEGRYSWAVDTPAAWDPDKLLNLAGGVEGGLVAAKLAAEETIFNLGTVAGQR